MLGAIPAHCKERSAFWSSTYIVRDVFAMVLVAKFAVAAGMADGGALYADAMAADSVLSLAYLRWAGAWSVYAWVMGTVATGLWVIAHECGHGAFSVSKGVNDAVGYLLHTALLVPYHSWQFTHHKHHKYTNHMTLGETHVPPTARGFKRSPFHAVHRVIGDDAFALFQAYNHLVLGWPAYLACNITGGRVDYKNERYGRGTKNSHFALIPGAHSDLFPPERRFGVFVSTVGMLAVLGTLGYATTVVGAGAVARWYVGPYLVVNVWLVLYTWLHHTHPSVPHYGPKEFSWLRGAVATVDRPYPWWIDLFHHKIGTTHVLHHVNFRIPHYHAEEASRAIQKVLGPRYHYDDQSIGQALWLAAKECLYVPEVAGVNYWVTGDDRHAAGKGKKKAS